MSEISYKPKKDHKKYLIISIVILFSLGVIVFLILSARKGNLTPKDFEESANKQEVDEKVLSPEEIQGALTKKAEETGDSQDSAINGTQIEDALKKEAAQEDGAQEAMPQEVKPLSPDEIQASLNKRL